MKPFVKISELERKAEEKFLSEEQALAEKLRKWKNKIQQLTKNNENESDVLSPQTIKAIEGFKSEMMTTRAELRNVKFNLRRDVENLKSTIMFINIGLLPTIEAALAPADCTPQTKKYEQLIRNAWNNMILRKFIYFLSLTVLLVFLHIFSTYKDDSSNLFAERGDVFLKT